jgi:hypothetical protein
MNDFEVIKHDNGDFEVVKSVEHSNRLTYEQLRHVFDSKDILILKNPNLRQGQALYNVVRDNCPRSMHNLPEICDPFYDDKNINRFISYITKDENG